MKIWNYELGPGHPVFVVAEGGSNHGGSLDAALALTDAAADAGADAMKWQLWLSADEIYDRAQFPDEWATADRYRLPIEWLPVLRDRAHQRGMAFGLSSFGFGSLDEADKWVDFHKVASIEHEWDDFLKAVTNKARPIFISLGMCESKTLPSSGMWVIPLACTVAYPCDLTEVDLLMHPPGPWGYSDHTLHPTIAPCAAVALGACVIEKHMRLLFQNFIGPDVGHSITEQEFGIMVRAVRDTERALGSSEKRIRPSEIGYLKYRRGPRGLRGA